jgi:galactokinase
MDTQTGVEAAAGDAFRDRYDAGPTTVASAPGRVNLVGGHTDHQEGYVLPVAVDRRTAVAGRPREDRTLRVYSAAFDESVTADLDALEPGGPQWANYVVGVLATLSPEGTDDPATHRPGRSDGPGAAGPVAAAELIPGVDLAVAGNVPLGAGLSSSASLEVAVAGAVNDLADLGVAPAALAAAAWRAETEFVGLSCGIMDQFASALGEATGAVFLDCRTRERRSVSLDPAALRLVVVDTTVRHELADSGYEDRVEACRRGVALLADALDRDVSALRDVTVEDVAAHGHRLPPEVRRRVEHVVSENDRVREATAALEAGEYARLGEILTTAHESLRDRFEVSVPEADAAVEAATETPGVYGARLTGGGFGGSVLALARPDAVDAFTESIGPAVERATGTRPDTYVCAPDDGVTARRVDRVGDDNGQ